MVPKRIGRCYELAGKVMTGGKPEANRFTLERALRATNCALASSSAAAWPSGAQVGGLAEDAEQRPEKAHVCRAGRAVRLCGPSPARPEAHTSHTSARCSDYVLRLLLLSIYGGNRRGGRRGRSRCMVDFARHRSRRDSPPNGLPRRCARSSASSIDDVAFRSPNANPAEEGTRPRQDLDPLETCSWRGVTAISWRGVTAILSFGLGRATKIKIE